MLGVVCGGLFPQFTRESAQKGADEVAVRCKVWLTVDLHMTTIHIL